MRFLAVLVALVCVVSVANAEVLSMGTTLPQGRFAVEGILTSNSNITAANLTEMRYGVKAAYGITDQWELDLAYLTGTYGNITNALGTTANSAKDSIPNIIVRYSALKESKDMPVSLAVGVGYGVVRGNTSATVVGPGTVIEGTTTTPVMGIGVTVSKIYAPFVPYAAVQYKSMSGDAAGTGLDLTVGTAIAWSLQGAVFIEYNNQAVNPTGGANYTTGQLAAGVAYVI